MILDQQITVTISKQGKHYKALGYGYLKQGTVITVPVGHLPKNCNVKVQATCDRCGIEFDRQLQLLNAAAEHLCYSCARKRVTEISDYSKAAEKARQRTGNKHPRWNPNKSDFHVYVNLVRRTTSKLDLTLLEHHDKRGMAGKEGAYHLDHIVSMKYGFDNKIPPEIIGAKENLRFIPWEENYHKGISSGMPVGALMALIELSGI